MEAIYAIYKRLVFLIITCCLIGCAGEDIPETSIDPSTAHVVSLTRVYQQVIRYDCEDNVTSDKIEEIDGPDKVMEIKPVTEVVEKVVDSSFRNSTTNDSGVITSYTKFAIDYDSLFTRMRVVAGINKIDYTFDFVDGAKEEGSRYINVYYSVVNKKGTQTRYPTEESCN